MNLYVIGLNLGKDAQARLRNSVSALLSRYPTLDRTTEQTFELTERDHIICVREAESRMRGRHPVFADNSSILVFDGAPISLEKGFAINAEQVARTWRADRSKIEGEFSLAHFDRMSRTLTVTTGLLGLRPLYWWTDGQETLISNSLLVIIAYRGEHSLDEQSVATLLGLQYLMQGDTLEADIARLPPGAFHSFDLTNRTYESTEYFSTTIALAERDALRKSGRANDFEPVGEDFSRTMSIACRNYEHVYLPLTAGTDSRALLAASLPYKDRIIYYTHGPDEHVDVRIAKELCRSLGVEHHGTRYGPVADVADFDVALEAFVERSDGLTSPTQMFVGLSQIIDPLNGTAAHRFPDIPAIVPGNGGELAKGQYATPFHVLTHPFCDAEIAGFAQRVMCHHPALSDGAAAVVNSRVSDFFTATKAAGAPRGDLLLLFYLWVRVGGWLAANRAARRFGEDYVTPALHRSFIIQSLALDYLSRTMSPIHRWFIEGASPSVTEVAFEKPMRPANRTASLVRGIGEFGLQTGKRTVKRMLGRPMIVGAAASGGDLLAMEYLRGVLPKLREQVVDHAGSIVWTLVDRDQFAKLMTLVGDPSVTLDAESVALILHVLQILVFERSARAVAKTLRDTNRMPWHRRPDQKDLAQ